MKFLSSDANADSIPLNDLRLAFSPGVGPVTFHSLLAQHGSSHAALLALGKDPSLMKKMKITSLFPEKSTQVIIDETYSADGFITTFSDSNYPTMLKSCNVKYPPPVLFMQGNRNIVHNLLKSQDKEERKAIIGIVGSRQASCSGLKLAEAFAYSLAKSGAIIVSGLARGIDAAAHTGAINACGEYIQSIGVIANGLDIFYPMENKRLQESLANNGLIITQSPPKTKPNKTLFPKRNGVIAGLCDALIVIEAWERSGSLITMSYAQKYHRVTMAIPGSPSDSLSSGPNKLIQDGRAYMVTSVDDVQFYLAKHLPNLALGKVKKVEEGLGEIEKGILTNIKKTHYRSIKEKTSIKTINIHNDSYKTKLENEKKSLLQYISSTPVSINDLVHLTGLSVREIRGSIFDLSIHHAIVFDAKGIYRR